MISDFLLNHLWQSTLFTVAAAFLTLLFRTNHARIRYAIWLAASIKFLIPFSLFIAIGNSIDFGRQSSATLTPSTINFVETISRPFDSPVLARAITASPNPDWRHRILPSAYAMWLGGFLAVLIFYLVKSRRISKEFCNAAPILQGRALELLRRLEPIAGGKPPIKLASSGALMEPGVFGIFKPVLLLPEGMAERLNDSELDAILAHELTHVRRRDNLAAAIQMFIEALFWFHPMVWWIGAKLVQERERACDEEVLRLGKDPQAYAEGILKVCEFYLESPLACVTGVTGSDMKQRIQAIMAHSIGGRLGLMKKLLLAAAGTAALAVPLTIGFMKAPALQAQSKSFWNMLAGANANQAEAANPKPFLQVQKMVIYEGERSEGDNSKLSFDVASVKPTEACGQTYRSGGNSMGLINPRIMSGGRFSVCDSLEGLVMLAYGIESPAQLSGLPAWSKEAFQIEAKTGPAARGDQMNSMLRTLLEERFKLKIRRESREADAYSLVVAKGGHKLQQAKDEDGNPIVTPPALPKLDPESMKGLAKIQIGQKPTAIPGMYSYSMSSGTGTIEVEGKAVQIKQLLRLLREAAGRKVVDKTGLTGVYDIKLNYVSEPGKSPFLIRQGGPGLVDPVKIPEELASGPTIFKALQKQLGLELQPDKGPQDYFTIESIERLSEN